MESNSSALGNEESSADLRKKHPFLESESALEEFVAAWKLGILPKRAWTHGAHVGVAAYFAFEHSVAETFAIMRKGIRHYNTCVGTANTEDSGYHETLTGFWSGEVGRLLRGGRFASKLAAVRAAVASFGEDRERHRLFYGFDVVRTGGQAGNGSNRTWTWRGPRRRVRVPKQTACSRSHISRPLALN